MTNPLLTKLEAEEAAIMHELNVLKGAIENAANIGSQRLAQLFHGAKDEIDAELKAVQAKSREAVASFKGKVDNSPALNASLPHNHPKGDGDAPGDEGHGDTDDPPNEKPAPGTPGGGVMNRLHGMISGK